MSSGDASGGRPAPAGALVAVLERRGRFLTAAPLFGGTLAGGSPRRQASARVVRDTRAVRRDGAQAREGDLVLVHADRRGTHIERVIGRPENARSVLEAFMLDRGLARAFEPELEREALASAERVRGGGERRRDLRELATFTIDPVAARDFDDAISAQGLGGERARVWVHIADVSAHVAEGGALDREARRRATSVYVPGSVEPMLPQALSSDACSLVPGVERPAVTVQLELNGADVEAAEFYRSLIRSDARLDYDRVDRIFAGGERAQDPWAQPLATARAAAAALQRRRERAGALVVDSEEPEFAFDAEGNVTEVRGNAQTESHRVIEHLMIAANEAVASMLSTRGVPCLYRVHEQPEPSSIERLVDQLASLEVPTPPVPEPLSGSQAARLVGEISRLVDSYTRRQGRGRIALGMLVLRSLRQAYYSPRNLGHAGLRSSAYCHFTSPIRRYPDIVCHRALLSTLGAPESAPRARELDELGAWTSERERDATAIERGADDIARSFALQSLLLERGYDATFAGEVTGLIGAGAFIAFGDERDARRGAAPAFEGMLPVRALPAPRAGAREWWDLNEQGTMLVGERTGAALRLGDAMQVRVERIDTIRGRVDLRAGG